jgi:hypothetical protein
MIWPFKKKIVEEPPLPHVAEIRFGGWRYTPALDITPHEAALLIPMFIHPF